MTKKHYLPLLLIFFSSILTAQEEYMQIIAEKSCECLSEKSAVNPNLSAEEMGTCLLLATKDYKAQLLEDYDLDLNDLTGGNAERLGELIGSHMAFVCPDVLIGASRDEQEHPTFTATGEILEISTETFVIFQLKNDNGRLEKFYWLTYVDSEFNLQNNYSDLTGEQVQIEYTEQELFDPRIKEYRKVNVITALNKE